MKRKKVVEILELVHAYGALQKCIGIQLGSGISEALIEPEKKKVLELYERIEKKLSKN